jgi:serine/threonine protein kinase
MSSDALPSGTKIAGFVLDTPLGQGGFGITYRARSEDGRLDYAVKEYFPAEYARRGTGGVVLPREGPEAARAFEIGRQAFLEEAFILKDLPRQPGLVRVRGAFEKHGTAYCLMDFIAGEPLDRVSQRMIARYGHVPEPHVQELISTLCRALGAVHGAGFVHRDIKPSNIMISATGTPVLIDFGAARRLGRASGSGSMLSRRYAALEQFPSQPRGFSAKEGPWTDLFALSVVLYELLSQGLPQSADVRAVEAAAGRRDPYVPVRENLRRNRVEVRYSHLLLDLVDCGCALHGRERPQSAADFRRPIEKMMLQPARSEGFAEAGRQEPYVQEPIESPGIGQQLPTDWRKVILMLVLILGLAVAAAAYGLLPQGGF